AGEDHQPAHGGRALLLQEMPLGTVFAYRLAFALPDAQRPDHLGREQKHDQQRGDQRAAGAEGDVAKDVEGGEFGGQLGQPIEHRPSPSPRPGQASAAGASKRRFKASTNGPMRLPNEPLTMIASPGPTASKSLG